MHGSTPRSSTQKIPSATRRRRARRRAVAGVQAAPPTYADGQAVNVWLTTGDLVSKLTPQTSLAFATNYRAVTIS
ncbi:hypothetical protein GCM10027610_054680 [Dactylosporangium cerinum]